MKIRAKKSLGQHFLLNPFTVDKIIEKAGVTSSDQILEIGPGPGVMTRRLAVKAAKVVAVEKDARFVKALRELLADQKNLEVIEGDILELNLEKILSSEKGKWKVIANLPYNIATEVIFHLLEVAYLFDSFHLMVQKEVADRLVAVPGSKDYGILSVFSQLLSENKIAMRLPPGAFTPPPQVSSAIVRFQLKEGTRFPIHHLPTFESVVRGAFAHRRKMIGNSLQQDLPLSSEIIQGTLKKVGIPSTARAETVSIGQFAKLANEFYMRGR